MSVETNPQTALGESVVDDPDLERLLEERLEAKEKAAAARKVYAELDEQAKGRVRELELGSSPARCGRFIIGESDVAGRSVAFETEATTRVSIRVAGRLF
jgi:hypothetical protein